MAEITIDQAIDLGKITLNAFKRDKFETTLKHHSYPILEKLYRDGAMDEQGGKLITRSITLGRTGNAKHVNLYQADTQNVVNIQEEVQAPWRQAQTSMSYEIREILANGGVRGFVKLMRVRKTNMYVELADELEERAWACPDSATDKINPYGIPYWITRGSADDTGSFGGLNPYYEDTAEITGGAGGLSSSTYTYWRNWFADYDAVNYTLLKQLSKAFRMVKFRSPATASDLEKGPLSNFKLYTNDAVIGSMEDLATKQDDRIGADLGKYADQIAFKRRPLEYVDVLDTAKTATFGTNPIFGVNYNHFYPVVLVGDKFRVSDPINDRALHNVLTVFCDLSYNYLCDNRREAGFLVSQIS